MGQHLNQGNAELVSMRADGRTGEGGLIAKPNKAVSGRRPRRHPK